MIYKGLMTKDEKADLKANYPDEKLQVYCRDGKNEIVFRLIYADVYERILEIKSSSDMDDISIRRQVDELVFDECVIWPVLDEVEKASLVVGTVPNMSKVIQERSGFVEIDVLGNILGPTTWVTPMQDVQAWGEFTPEVVEQIKADTQFPVYRIRIDEYVWISRPMTKVDVEFAQSQADPTTSLCRATTFWPAEDVINWSRIPAGYIEELANGIARISGYATKSSDVEITEL